MVKFGVKMVGYQFWLKHGNLFSDLIDRIINKQQFASHFKWLQKPILVQQKTCIINDVG